MLLALSSAAWAMLTLSHQPAWLKFCVGSPTVLDRFSAHLRGAATTGYLPAIAMHWTMMVAAMMSPLLLEPARQVVFRSMAQRRTRAPILFVVGYAATWGLIGVGVLIALLVVRTGDGMAFAPVVVALSAAIWQVTNQRRLALRRCHRVPPLRARGVGADLDCLTFGVRHALACALICGPVMMAVMMSPLMLSAGALAALLLFFERGVLEANARPLALLLLGLAGFALMS